MTSSLEDNSLLHNLDRIHTTKMGAERIKRNLGLQTDDVVAWCREAIRQADLNIGLGKNWYIYGSGVVITINGSSFTVITAHRINARVREIRESDYACLPEFLFQAIHVPEGVEPPQRSIINDPNIILYIKDFGTQQGDLGMVAKCEVTGQIIGAAWTRIIPAYGQIDQDTPELAISILPPFRAYGIGTKLMNNLFQVLRKNGYKQTSLSVQKDNPAVRFYQRLGYGMWGERLDHAGHEDYLMVKNLNGDNARIPDEAKDAAAAIKDAFGSLLLAVYLYGSAVSGGLRKDSDVDILAVVNGEPAKEVLRKLSSRLLAISGKIGNTESRRPLEVTVVCKADVSPWQFPPRMLFQYGEWLREQFEHEEYPEPESNPDLTILLSQIRQRSIALFGSPAPDMISPIPNEDLQRAMKNCLPDLMQNLHGDERNVLLTLARIWATAVTGQFMPKDEAAEWAVLRIAPDYGNLLNLCAKAYRGECRDHWEPTSDAADKLANELKRAILETLLTSLFLNNQQ